MFPRLKLTRVEIVALISRLAQRPVRADHCLLSIWLSGRTQGTEVFGMLIERLNILRRYLVPHVRVEATTGTHALRAALAAPRFGSERPPFRHYELAEWLMGLNLPRLGTEDRAREIIALLRERHRRRSQDIDREINEIDLEPQYRLPFWLISRVSPKVFFCAAVSSKFLFTQNRTVHNRWEDRNRMRPHVTLVYLGIFTGMPINPGEEVYTAEREELEGLAIAQPDSIDQLAISGDPLLHIVIANGGRDMQYARRYRRHDRTFDRKRSHSGKRNPRVEEEC